MLPQCYRNATAMLQCYTLFRHRGRSCGSTWTATGPTAGSNVEESKTPPCAVSMSMSMSRGLGRRVSPSSGGPCERRLREVERNWERRKDHEKSWKIVELRHGLQGVWEFIHIAKLEEYNVHFGIHVTQCSADSSAGTASCWLESQQRTCTGALHVSRTQEVIFTDVYSLYTDVRYTPYI
jgi:hypothetical protein